jgi:hypothetical protein
VGLVSAVIKTSSSIKVGNLYSIGGTISFSGRFPLHGECKDRHSYRTHPKYVSEVYPYLTRSEALTAVLMIKSVMWRLVCW